MTPQTVLGVWAHPDDEAYLMSGLTQQVQAAGGRVVLATATWGERGETPQSWPVERVRELRRRELRDSLDALGVTDHRFLGFEDGACADVPMAVGTAAVRQVIADVQPDTVVTFGPEGMTGHPDHRAVSAWTSAAVGPEHSLWWATLTDYFHATWGDLNEAVGLWGEFTPPSTSAADLAHVVHLDGTVLDRKVAALRAHGSQTGGLEARVGADVYRQWWAVEAFRGPT